MKRIIIIIFILFLVQSFYLSKVWANEYSLTSTDGQVKVVLDSQFGGAITQVYDYADFGNTNLIDGYQAGAMFQTAFWVLPYHNYQPPYVNNDSRFPPGCLQMTSDQTLDNPTQAGFLGDGKAGNPIGIMGTDTSTPDPNEFINYENNNKTVHLKTKFIRYDYCKNGSAPMSEQQWWDTDFYLEQWVSFNPNLPRTLTLRNKITYVGTGQKSITTRQLPVIFACNLPRVAYWQGGQKVINFNTAEAPINPDTNWAALIASNKEAGIGMVTSNTMSPMLGRGKFTYSEINGSINQCDNNGPLSVIYPGGGVPDLRTTGTLNNVDYDQSSGHVFIFNPGGTFDWTTYYPIGDLNSVIKPAADALLTPTISCNLSGSATAVVGTGQSYSETPVGTAISTNLWYTSSASNFESGNPNPWINVCNGGSSGCSGNITFPSPGTYWVAGNTSNSNRTCSANPACKTDPSWCQNLGFVDCGDSCRTLVTVQSSQPTPPPPPPPTATKIPLSPTPIPIPGDLNHDRKVDMTDYNQLVADFGKTGSPGFIPSDINSDGKVDIFDYNILVGNWGK